MQSPRPLPGQRWSSDTEPELGLGIIESAAEGRVKVSFPATGETRQYAMTSAPLRRVVFEDGDDIDLTDGRSLKVAHRREVGGLFVYETESGSIPERELAGAVTAHGPVERLFSGVVDEPALFALRLDALQWQHEWRKSSVRGYVGARIDLIPHQIYIAAEVASRWRPRVLLADEVGLGKTIECGLILHRLHLTGRAHRILILVPEPLIHQWFVELLRKFNLLFAIFDEERCVAIAGGDNTINPFLDSQLVLASIGWLSGTGERAGQAADAEWDLVIVDEAHHLGWTPEQASPEHSFVEKLAARTPGLLLVTATPQQLGVAAHFSRLRLLDPERYDDLATYLKEAEHHEEVAGAVEALLDQKDRLPPRSRWLERASPSAQAWFQKLEAGNESAREPLVRCLLDEFGMGRVMFRNMRSALQGFPARKAHLHILAAPESTEPDTADDTAVVSWLADLLRRHSSEKFLLICSSPDRAEALREQLLQKINVPSAVFHEGLTLLQRDRQAASFSDEDGARLLLCSEIGSEGRNFQFAHHLILLDLPEHPEKLEQRIGRLDRIGQTSTIHIHVPVASGSRDEALARWYHEGLKAFTEHLHGGAQLYDLLRPQLETVLLAPQHQGLDDLLERSKEERRHLVRRLARGQDRLLALSSCRADTASDIIDEIRHQSEEEAFDEFFLQLMEHFGIQVEDLEQRRYLLRPGNDSTHAIPGLPPEGLDGTFDRSTALHREDVVFLSTDHPLPRGAVDLFLSTSDGTASFALWKNSGGSGLLLEAVFVLECPAPPAFQIDRFLAPVPVRVTVDHDGRPLAGTVLDRAKLSPADASMLRKNPALRRKVLPALLAAATDLAKQHQQTLSRAATDCMITQLDHEITRLQDLSQLNHHVRQEEWQHLETQKHQLTLSLAQSHLRLDTIRLIWRMP